MKMFSSPLTAFLLFFCLYLLTLTSNFTGPHDSMTYLYMLKSGEHLWHPHHLLYHVSSLYWMCALKPLFPHTPSYYLVESFSSFWGAATLAVVFLFFKNRFKLPLLTCWLGTAVAGFCYGIWFYSANVEVYMPSLFLVILALYYVTKEYWTQKDFLIVVLLHSLALLYHQMYILFTLIVLYKLYEQRDHLSFFKNLFLYAAIGILLVGGIYLWAGFEGEKTGDLTTWFTWVRGYMAEKNDYWRPLSWKTPVYAGIGFSHAIVGGHFIFRLDGFEQRFGAFLNDHSLQDEMYLVRHLSSSMAAFLSILSLLLVGLTILLLVRSIRKFSEIKKNQKHIVIPLLVFFLVYSFYFLFWTPEILEFWLAQSIVLWLLLIGTQKKNKALNIIVGAIAALLFLVNYISSIRPMQNIHNDIGYARIEKLLPVLKKDDLIIVQDPWLLKEFLEYLADTEVITVPLEGDTAAQKQVVQKVNEKLTEGKKVYVFTDFNSKNASPNKGFIPDLLHTYEARKEVFQEQLTHIILIQ